MPFTEEQIEYMTKRFMSWSLPDNFQPDNGISFKRLTFMEIPYPMPMGTNLLSATQAEAMVRHMIEGMPQ